ncbi:hypothetical protein F2Q69_00049292 [Brassica cretica]|uniref:Uncharacterized protein n=1 Tax=Brassica cretica TaxID=69181 RepID=A0A8S9PDK8_BRACR|nr:hypothetical protein F2Q69_00049292 [Brassica cretica]
MAKKKPRQSDVRKTVPYAGLNARALKGSFTINPQPSQGTPLIITKWQRRNLDKVMSGKQCLMLDSMLEL